MLPLKNKRLNRQFHLVAVSQPGQKPLLPIQPPPLFIG